MVVEVLDMLPNAEFLAGVLEMEVLARVQGFQLRGREFSRMCRRRVMGWSPW
jgi:hypothetical protein